MVVKSLRQKHNWSQEQLAQLSGLHIRTIQRVEKGESVGLETLKSLAAVFHVSVEDLQENKRISEANAKAELEQRQKDAEAEVRAKKLFYMLSLFLIGTYVVFFLPNYNQGENLEALVFTAVCYLFIIGAHFISVFKPFGENWEKKQVKKILDEYEEQEKD